MPQNKLIMSFEWNYCTQALSVRWTPYDIHRSILCFGGCVWYWNIGWSRSCQEKLGLWFILGTKLAFALFKKTIQHFALFLKLIREILLFWNSIFLKSSFKKKNILEPYSSVLRSTIVSCFHIIVDSTN